MTRYRFLDGMGEVVAEREFAGHADALAWAVDAPDDAPDDRPDEQVQRVEFLGPDGDWRWAGALQG